jgi:hypothetical protein
MTPWIPVAVRLATFRLAVLRLLRRTQRGDVKAERARRNASTNDSVRRASQQLWSQAMLRRGLIVWWYRVRYGSRHSRKWWYRRPYTSPQERKAALAARAQNEVLVTSTGIVRPSQDGRAYDPATDSA